MRTRFNNPLVLSVFALLLVLAGYYTFQSVRFRLVNSIPSTNGIVATSTNGFELNFNKPLNQSADYVKSLRDPQHIVNRIRVSDRKITIQINPLLQSKHYEFSLNKVLAESGKVIEVINFNFNAKYIPYEKLSSAQKKLITQISAQHRLDYPLLGHIPYSTLDFSLEAIFFGGQNESSTPGPPTIQATLFLSHADVQNNKNAAIDQYKQEVNDYIKSLNLNPSDYNIEYVIAESS